VDYKSLMQQAIVLAKEAAVKGDVPVGALVVDNLGNVVGKGSNLREQNNDPTAHAENVAIKNAGDKIGNWRLDDLTLVVTLEPCVMCAGTFAQSRMKRLVFGAFDEKSGAVGSIWDVIRDPRALTKIEVVSGVLADECETLMKEFFLYKRID
jgi:tRNA(adenine34) deaminase